jgi:hypothetical protein
VDPVSRPLIFLSLLAQGLEIVTPHAKEEAKTAGKYIGNMKFVNVKK